MLKKYEIGVDLTYFLEENDVVMTFDGTALLAYNKVIQETQGGQVSALPITLINVIF